MGWFSRWWDHHVVEWSLDNVKSEQMERIRKKLLEKIPNVPSILEVGAGSGLNFVHYPSFVKSLTVLTLDPKLSVRAQSKANERGLTVQHAQGDVQDVPMFLKEISRVLKEDGKYFFYEHNAVPHEERSFLVPWVAPVHRLFTVGCNIDRTFPADAFKSAGLRIDWVEEETSEFAPKLFGKLRYGVATKYSTLTEEQL